MRKALVSLAVLGSLFVVAPPAEAAFPQDLFDGALACQTVPAGTPSVGGQRWCGTDGGNATAPSTVPSFDGTPIDVQVTLPPAPAAGPDGDFPVIGVFHGYGGQKYAHANANDVQRWVQRGYAVFNPTTRGFWGSCGVKINPKPASCANGYIHLMSTQWEVRDFQYLLGELADDGAVDGQRIGVVGQSYGGGASMLLGALKNRVVEGALPGETDGEHVPWVSAGGQDMQIAAAAPEFGWSDLMHSLVPNGSFYDYAAENPYRGPAGDRRAGVQKLGWVERLYGGGQQTGFYSNGDERYDVPDIRNALSAGEGYDANTEIQDAIDEFAEHHSSYYVDDSVAPAPTLLSQGWNDDLFPVGEALRYYNKVREHHPDNPINLWAFDWGHTPRSAINVDNVTSLYLAEFTWMDHYVKGTGPAPEDEAGGVNVIASGCTDGTSSAQPTSTPLVHADNWAELANGELRANGGEPVTIPAETQAAEAFQSFGPNPPATTVCTTSGTAQTPGAATYTVTEQPTAYTVAGAPTIIADITVGGPEDRIVGRLYDVDEANETQRLISRGVYRPIRTTAGTEQAVFQLSPQMWRVQPGHELKLELLTTDSPYLRTAPSQNAIDVDDVELRVPTRDAPNASSQIDEPAAKVLPPGYELARDFAAQVTPEPTASPTASPTAIPTATPTYPIKRKPGLTARARPRRDRSKPFVFRVQGRLVLPGGVPKSAGCKGTVRIIAKKGRKTVGKRRTGVKSTCKYKARVKLRKNAGKRGKVKFRAKFLGNDRLFGAKAKAAARYGR